MAEMLEVALIPSSRLLRKVLRQRLLVVFLETRVVVASSQGALVIRHVDIDVTSAVKLRRRPGRSATTALLSQGSLGRSARDGSSWRRRRERWRQRWAVLGLSAGEGTVVVIVGLELGRGGGSCGDRR